MDKRETGQILKTTTIFGGAQIIIVISGLVKSKIVALLIGPTGVGISALYNNIVAMLSGIIGLGIGLSAIREIAKEENLERKLETALLTKRLVLLLSIAGLLITFLSSRLLSEIQFGNSQYTYGFCIIALAIAFTIFTTGTDACLKGFRRTKQIAVASLYNSLGGVVISAFVYYYIGLSGIPYAITLCAFLSFIISWYFSRDITPGSRKKSNIKETITQGYPMILLGIMLVLSYLIDSIVANVLNIVIRIKGNISDVGLFQAGLSISSMSINMVFVAIANDYFPKLSKDCDNKIDMNATVNSQMFVATLLIAPILAFMIVFSSLLIKMFLSSDFFEIETFIHWILFGSFFMAMSWCLYYVPLAHGHSKRFMYVALSKVFMQVLIQIPLFLLGGLVGLAIGSAVTAITYAVVMYLYDFRVYGVRIKLENIYLQLLFSILLIVLIVLKVESFFIPQLLTLLIITVFSLYLLLKNTNVYSSVKNKIMKR